MFTLAHISDLHLSYISKNPLQFFSKRWLGNANLIFCRSKLYKDPPLKELFSEFKKEAINYLLITGDLSSTSHKKEFALAQEWLNHMSDLGITIFYLPGNHDNYTKKAHREKIFYKYFSNYTSIYFHLEEDGVEVHKLDQHWHLILLDTTLATPLFSSKGLFSHQIEKNLEKALSLLPKETKIIIANHFPFTLHISPRKILSRAKNLRAILENDPRIVLYLHGHTHNHSIADLRGSHLPIVMESGSTSHIEKGSWNYLKFSHQTIDVTPFFWEDHHWQEKEKIHFSL